MGSQLQDAIKHRTLEFRGPHEDTHQARTAARVLNSIKGVIKAYPVHAELLHISYDLRFINLQMIDGLLIELGFHLDNNLLMKLRRALYYYSEEAVQDVLGYRSARDNSTQAVFINRYRKLEHGCRDVRPDHYRQYL